jgi:hypothetical protein
MCPSQKESTIGGGVLLTLDQIITIILKINKWSTCEDDFKLIFRTIFQYMMSTPRVKKTCHLYRYLVAQGGFPSVV